MNLRKILVISFLTAAVTSGCNDTKQQYELVSVSGGLPASDQKMSKEALGFDLLRKVSLGNWQCYVPHEHPDDMFFCTHGSRIVFQAYGKNLNDLYIPTTSGNLSFVILRDNDLDGVFDALSYDGIDEAGNISRQVYDENLDGIPDKLLDFKTNTLKVRLGDKWLESRSSDKRDPSGKVIYEITVDGEKKRIYPHSYPYKVEELKSNKALQPTTKSGG